MKVEVPELERRLDDTNAALARLEKLMGRMLAELEAARGA